jgi:hypothetical protein
MPAVPSRRRLPPQSGRLSRGEVAACCGALLVSLLLFRDHTTPSRRWSHPGIVLPAAPKPFAFDAMPRRILTSVWVSVYTQWSTMKSLPLQNDIVASEPSGLKVGAQQFPRPILSTATKPSDKSATQVHGNFGLKLPGVVSTLIGGADLAISLLKVFWSVADAGLALSPIMRSAASSRYLMSILLYPTFPRWTAPVVEGDDVLGRRRRFVTMKPTRGWSRQPRAQQQERVSSEP